MLLLRWIISAVALYLTVVIGRRLGLAFYIAPGATGLEGVFWFTAVLGVLNAVLRPFVRLVALPLSCLTFGLFAFVINGLMFWIAGQITPGFHVRGFLPPIAGSVVMGVISGALNFLLASGREGPRNVANATDHHNRPVRRG